MKPKKKAPEPIVYDGVRQAIANIRTRKKILQKDAATKAGITSSRWSEIETGVKKKLSVEERRVVTTGLGCTEIELWEEKVRVERDYYRRRAMEIGETKPSYDSSSLATYVEALYRLDVSHLPDKRRAAFSDLRNAAAATVAAAFTLVDRMRDMYQADRK